MASAADHGRPRQFIFVSMPGINSIRDPKIDEGGDDPAAAAADVDLCKGRIDIGVAAALDIGERRVDHAVAVTAVVIAMIVPPVLARCVDFRDRAGACRRCRHGCRRQGLGRRCKLRQGKPRCGRKGE